ncbi:hypothetical protein SNE26_07650 [Mucilaginibacter sp. cycad4]|uniref:hypothetical protein n=1 Tax=Mucilaginibacter sp. cycad4 TaxID=3342096 RepID=UPI002AAC36D5|nr:hypothetical protein [Mucilaginibacter gossypii]WPV01646.1 hypothetical protein SNE26_07650 [Mucilaginibacter gossypii]
MILSIFFLIIVALTVLFFIAATGKLHPIILAYLIWNIIIGVLSYNHFFQNTSTLPPRILLVIIPAVIFVTLAYKNITATTIKTKWLYAIHALRLPVEICLFQLYQNGKVPKLMTFEGWNFDILTGITAIILIFTADKFSKKLIRYWHYLGLTLLSVIVILAILSAPSPIQQLARSQPNTAILMFPFTLLPGLVVPIVFLSHLLSSHCAS